MLVLASGEMRKTLVIMYLTLRIQTPFFYLLSAVFPLFLCVPRSHCTNSQQDWLNIIIFIVLILLLVLLLFINIIIINNIILIIVIIIIIINITIIIIIIIIIIISITYELLVLLSSFV